MPPLPSLLLLLLVVLTGCADPGDDPPAPADRPTQTNAVTSTAAPREPLTDAIPGARSVRSTTSGLTAWVAGPTDVYGHGALGDRVEGTQVRVLDQGTGVGGTWTAPEGTVVEDLRPRFADVDGDGDEEVVVVVSDLREGASAAVLDVDLPRVDLLARGPTIGRTNRWLNTLPPLDVDGDGDDEVAYVRTPHIGGDLVVLDLAGGTLQTLSVTPGFSNHALGSEEQDLALALQGTAVGPAWLLPVDGRDRLILVDATDPDEVIADVHLPGPAVGPLEPGGVVLDGGERYPLPDGLLGEATVVTRDEVVAAG